MDLTRLWCFPIKIKCKYHPLLLFIICWHSSNMIIPYDLLVVLLMALYLEPRGLLNYSLLSQTKIQWMEGTRCIKWIGAHCGTWILSNYYIDSGFGCPQNIVNRTPESNPIKPKQMGSENNSSREEDGNREASINN
jgi:hypothetical protein